MSIAVLLVPLVCSLFYISLFFRTELIVCLFLCIIYGSVTYPWSLTLNLLMTTIVAPPSNANKWQMGFNSAFKGLSFIHTNSCTFSYNYVSVF